MNIGYSSLFLKIKIEKAKKLNGRNHSMKIRMICLLLFTHQSYFSKLPARN